MKLKLLQLNSNYIKSTFTGKIAFSDLNKIATITYREVDDNGINNKFFQRPSDENKIKNISNFIKKILLNESGSLKRDGKSIVLFPTAIIVSLNEKDENRDDTINWDEQYLSFDTDSYKAFIIDGQHRFLGIKKFYEDTGLTKDDIDIEFPITILTGYDIWEQSKIFAVVNFEQKPVNKSLYYDLFGTMKGEYNEITLSHSIVKYLNYTKSSPFFRLVKMLGTGSGVISQAFLVEKIRGLLKPKKAFSILYDDYKNKKIKPVVLADILLVYFSAIKEKFIQYYPKQNEKERYSIFNQSILFKTTGVGVFLRLLNDFEKEIKMNSDDINYLRKYFDRMFSLINQDEAKHFFSKEGSYSGSGSEGLQSKLYNNLRNIINYKKDVIGKKYNNAVIIEIKLSNDYHGRNVHDLTLSNGTTTRINDEELGKINPST